MFHSFKVSSRTLHWLNPCSLFLFLLKRRSVHIKSLSQIENRSRSIVCDVPLTCRWNHNNKRKCYWKHHQISIQLSAEQCHYSSLNPNKLCFSFLNFYLTLKSRKEISCSFKWLHGYNQVSYCTKGYVQCL